MTTDDWDMHSAGAEILARRMERLDDGVEVTAEVVCHHPFGIGVRLIDVDDFGHLNVPAIRPLAGTVVDETSYPAIGTRIRATVLGYSGADQQLRLQMIGAPSDR